MMDNRISLTWGSIVSWACWLTGLVLALGDMFRFTPEDSGFVGIAFMALGHLVVVKRAIAEAEQRERTAFDLGRQAGMRTVK